MARIGHAMADPTRARILLRLLDAPGHPGEMAVDLDLTRSNVSNHLSCLRGCGIVVAVPEGRSTRYELADPHIGVALSALLDVFLAVDEGHACINDCEDETQACHDCCPEGPVASSDETGGGVVVRTEADHGGGVAARSAGIA